MNLSWSSHPTPATNSKSTSPQFEPIAPPHCCCGSPDCIPSALIQALASKPSLSIAPARSIDQSNSRSRWAFASKMGLMISLTHLFQSRTAPYKITLNPISSAWNSITLDCLSWYRLWCVFHSWCCHWPFTPMSKFSSFCSLYAPDQNRWYA